MSLNCLTCQKLPRVDSEKELSERCVGGVVDKPQFKVGWSKADRTWSGNLIPRPPIYEKMRNNEQPAMAGKRAKNGHRRLHSSAPLGYESGPRLARSSGMRRDWSFEDLRQIRDEKMKEVQGR